MIKQVSYIKQENKTDCGISCLLSICKFYGLNVPREWLYKESFSDQSGVSMYGLIQAATKLGFKAEAKRGKTKYLSDEITPFIAHTQIKEYKNLHHFIVVVEIGKKKIKIMDPAKGFLKFSYQEFDEITTGNYLFLYKTSNIRSITLKQNVQRLMKNAIKKHYPIFILLLCLIPFEMWLEFCTLFRFKILINHALLTKSIHNVKILGLLFFQFSFFQSILSYTISQYELFLELQITKQLKHHFFNQFLTLPIRYYQLRETGSILTLIDDINLISSFFSRSIYLLIHNVLLLVFLYSYVSYLSHLISIILLCASLLFTIYILYEKKYQTKIYEAFQKEKINKQKHYMMIIQSIETIKGMHLEKQKKKTIFQQENKYLKLHEQIQKRKNLQQTVFSFLENGVYLFTICSSIYLFITDKLSISFSSFLLLEGFMMSILKSYNQLLLWYLQKQTYKEAIIRLNNFFYCKSENLLFHQKLNDKKQIQIINIKNLSFSYNEYLILNGVNLSIKKKDKIFLSGKSGSGKTTLLKLLCRYYKVSYGMVTIDERDLTHYNLDTIRCMITYLKPQETIMADSLENIILFHRKKDIDRFKLVTSICKIDDILKETGYTYQTYIEENGANLSCGQRQRVLLAQGLYQKSEIYILDECLSMVDLTIEEKIIKELNFSFEDKIIIYVSHRLQHKMLFERRILLKDGKCYEES